MAVMRSIQKQKVYGRHKVLNEKNPGRSTCRTRTQGRHSQLVVNAGSNVKRNYKLSMGYLMLQKKHEYKSFPAQSPLLEHSFEFFFNWTVCPSFRSSVGNVKFYRYSQSVWPDLEYERRSRVLFYSNFGAYTLDLPQVVLKKAANSRQLTEPKGAWNLRSASRKVFF